MLNNSPIIVKQQRMSLKLCALLFALSALIAVAGVDYALVTNEHAILTTSIERVRTKTASASESANTYMARAQEQTHRYALLDRLSQSDSELIPIKREQIQTVQSELYLPLSTGMTGQGELTHQPRVSLPRAL